jgi:hypothetical protein
VIVISVASFWVGESYVSGIGGLGNEIEQPLKVTFMKNIPLRLENDRMEIGLGVKF